MAQTHLVQALLDTGSAVSLVKNSLAEDLQLEIDRTPRTTKLVGISGTKLKTLGITQMPLTVGTETTFETEVTVVPDGYLDTEVLLGMDILSKFPITWNLKEKEIRWGNSSLPVHRIKIKKNRKRTLKVKETPGQGMDLNLDQPILLRAHTTQIPSIKVNLAEGTPLVYTPNKKILPSGPPICTLVRDSRVNVPLANHHGVTKSLRTGTKLGTLEIVGENWQVEPQATRPEACKKINIQNELVPYSDQSPRVGSREERLQQLLEQKDWSHLPQKQKQKLFSLLKKHHELFILHPDELGLVEGEPAHIHAKDQVPIRAPTYRYPEQAKETVREMLKEMEERDITEPSTSAWLSPVVLVNKPDGKKRLCLDYRQVNTKLEADIQPPPRIEELVESAMGQKYYCTLDMKDAYYQILLDEGSRDLTTFSDGVTLYRFKRLPFGLSCSPTIFTRKMNNIIQELAPAGWLKNFIDDLILWAPTYETLLKKLDIGFDHLEKKGLKLNVSKCCFAFKDVKFLGHIISEKGCSPDLENVAAVSRMKPPTTVKEVRRFIGMVGFYRKYIASFFQKLQFLLPI